MLSLVQFVSDSPYYKFTLVSLQGQVAILGLLILSLGAHEAAHAWTALRCGDTTGRDLGRITLNPIPHIDPVMSILLPGIMILSGTGWLFGGARPVPVNFYNLRRPYRDMALVALAGPATNFLIALLIYPIYHALERTGAYEEKLLPLILFWTVRWNLLLAAFNLLPIPPLDGSRVLAWLLPRPLRPAYAAIEPYGLFLLFGLMMLLPGLVNSAIVPTLSAMAHAVQWFGTLGGRW